MINYLTFFILLSNAFMFAEEELSEGAESFAYCIKDDQKIDTSDWITFPIDFGSFDMVAGVDYVERIIVSLPSEPQFVQKNGMQSSYITVSDQEGMSYSIARMEIPSNDFSLSQSVNFLAESISKSSSKKLISWGWPDSNPNDSIYFMMWVEADKMTRLTLVKSTHSVYFLETSICNEIYRDFDWESTERDTVAFDAIMRDSLKTNIFTRSFLVE